VFAARESRAGIVKFQGWHFPWTFSENSFCFVPFPIRLKAGLKPSLPILKNLDWVQAMVICYRMYEAKHNGMFVAMF